MEPQKARGTSVFCILPMVLTSSFFYYKGNFINWKTAILCGIGGAIGGYIGAKLLKKLPDKVLKIAFTIFLIYVSLKMILKWKCYLSYNKNGVLWKKEENRRKMS